MHAQGTGEGPSEGVGELNSTSADAMQVEKVSVIDHPQLQDGMCTHWADAAMMDHMEASWDQASYDLVREPVSPDSSPTPRV